MQNVRDGGKLSHGTLRSHKNQTKLSVTNSFDRDAGEVIRKIVQRGEGKRRGSYFGWLGRVGQPVNLRAYNVEEEQLMSPSKADGDQQAILIETRFDREAQ
jgi:hypothetical protein